MSKNILYITNEINGELVTLPPKEKRTITKN